MAEWARVAARLDTMNTHPGGGLNLDGGDSTTLGVVERDGTNALQIRQKPTAALSTFVAFTRERS